MDLLPHWFCVTVRAHGRFENGLPTDLECYLSQLPRKWWRNTFLEIVHDATESMRFSNHSRMWKKVKRFWSKIIQLLLSLWRVVELISIFTVCLTPTFFLAKTNNWWVIFTNILLVASCTFVQRMLTSVGKVLVVFACSLINRKVTTSLTKCKNIVLKRSRQGLVTYKQQASKRKCTLIKFLCCKKKSRSFSVEAKSFHPFCRDIVVFFSRRKVIKYN